MRCQVYVEIGELVLWLVIAFISSTESCMIGYNAQRARKNTSVSGSAPASERRFEFSS